MDRRRIILSAVVVVIVILALAIPAVAASEWKTKATVNSKGAGPSMTWALVGTVVERPAAVRVGFRTPQGASRTVHYGWALECENRTAERWDRTVTTPEDGSWQYVTIQRPTEGLGRFCDVVAVGDLDDRTRLHMRIEAQHQ
jgi:hypothetical protein